MMRRLAAFALIAGTALVTTLTLAQTKPTTPPHHHPKPKSAADAGPPAQTEASPVPLRDTEPHASDAGTIAMMSKTLDGGTRVFRFGEVEIEGRLRNPQLVYFLRRVRAEFAAGDLGHRSFMRELSDTRHDPSF
jgi:hypothetical protein